jgi:ribosome-associated translation inhibitor RaiA
MPPGSAPVCASPINAAFPINAAPATHAASPINAAPATHAAPDTVPLAIRTGGVDLPDETLLRAEAKLQRLAVHLAKVAPIDRAEVRFSEPPTAPKAARVRCELTILTILTVTILGSPAAVTMHPHGHTLKTAASGPDPAAAVDRAMHKMEHRIAKFKGRIHARSHPRRRRQLDSSPDRASAHGAVDHADENHARIVKTKQSASKPMTPEEAVLHMEHMERMALAGSGFFLFTNAETNKAAVVYRRGDGFIGLIDAVS